MEQTIKQQQQELIEKLQQRQEELLKKFDAEGYVVAGYGGDTYYCFVGTGRGFNGAALAPLSRRPHIFTTKQEAQREANNGRRTRPPIPPQHTNPIESGATMPSHSTIAPSAATVRG